MKTKEEIQAQINILERVKEYIDDSYLRTLNEDIDDLIEESQSTKSIKDIQQEAFEAGRLVSGKFSDYPLTNDLLQHQTIVYNTFEDYLKSKENEK